MGRGAAGALLAALLALALAAGGGAACEDAGAPPAAPTAHARADDAFHALLRTFWLERVDLLAGVLVPRMPASYWIMAQAFDVLLDNAERTGCCRGLIETFYRGLAREGWTSDKFDDENWMVLALLRAHALTGEARYRETAIAIFDDIWTEASDATCCGPSPGGLWWDRAHTQKATVSNAGPAIAAVRLWRLTGEPAYLARARELYAHWRAHMVDPATHQVADHIEPGGEVLWWSYTYNEGLMVGASVELHLATGEAAYLTDARAFAARLRAAQTTPTPSGPVLHDGANAACGGDCPEFKGIAYRYLVLLERVSPSPEVRELLDASAASIWETARDPATGHFGADWSAPPPSPQIYLEPDSAACAALALHASLAPPHAYPRQAGAFEAEEAILHHAAIAAERAGHSGWGYASTGNAADGSVAFELLAERAGPHVVRLRWAAPAGAARRRLTLDGAVLVADQAFAATPEAEGFAALEVPVALPAGSSVFAVEHDRAVGLGGILLLDRVEVRAR